MTDSISTYGLQLINASNLINGMKTLGTLNQQLATGKKALSLTEYSSSDAEQLMNFTNSITLRESFLDVANAVNPRIKVYDQSLTSIEDMAALAGNVTTASPTYNPEQNGSIAQQLQGYLQQISYYLNQKVGDRYIYAGSRYGTVPVGDLTALPTPPTETAPYTTTGNALPTYDTDYDSLNPTLAVPEAYVKDQVAIDTTQYLQYGIVSTDDAFQTLIMGLRFAYSATQDTANYASHMTTARALIAQGLEDVRGLHSGLSAAGNTLNTTQELHKNNISALKQQISDIQSVDINAVAIQLNTFHASLEASYAATAKMTSMSILKYL